MEDSSTNDTQNLITELKARIQAGYGLDQTFGHFYRELEKTGFENMPKFSFSGIKAYLGMGQNS